MVPESVNLTALLDNGHERSPRYALEAAKRLGIRLALSWGANANMTSGRQQLVTLRGKQSSVEVGATQLRSGTGSDRWV
jgi:hypothetical protein